MMHLPLPARRRLRLDLHTSVAFLVLACAAAPAVAQCPRLSNGIINDDCAKIPTTVPSNVWTGSGMKPADPSPLPKSPTPNKRYTSDFNEFSGPESAVPWFMSLDIENGYVFVAGGYRLQIWSNGIPTSGDGNVDMNLLGEVKGQGSGSGAFPFLYQGESSEPILDVDAPDGDDSVVALVGYANMGMSIIDTSVKAAPKLVYQDVGKAATEVYAARLGGTVYGFMSQIQPTPSGLQLYNMSRAVANGRCSEPAQSCPGVNLGRIGTKASRYVDGVGNFVVSSAGTSRGYEIWNVASPTDPQLKFSGLTNQPVYGVAMWTDGGKYYLALATFVSGAYQGQIYDVSCITSACTGAPPLLSQMEIKGGPASNFVTFSRAGSTPYIHFGTDDWSGVRTFDREFLVDVSNPRSMRVVSPPGYWSYTHNFNYVRPGRGKFYGQYFYRAAQGMMDVHKLVGTIPPTAGFSWSPTEIYPGTPVAFQDTSFGSPTSWSWAFADGTPPSSTQASPSGIVFGSTGTKIVGLTATNAAGFNSVNHSLTVLDPHPAIAAAGAVPGSALLCQPITFSASGVTGRPALSYAWEVRSGQNALVASGSNPSLTWTSQPADSPGTYTATVTVSNQDGTQSKSTNVTLLALPVLAFTNPTNALITTDPITSGPVTFHAPASTGATSWQWDFGDGPPVTLTDPITGPNPTHSYATAGQKVVKVKIWNCVTGDVAGLTSLPITITVTPTPLSAGFEAQNCAGFQGACSFAVGSTVTFANSSSGGPDTYDYDWDGNGIYEDAGHGSPVTSHTYAAAASHFFPKVKVHRGAETAVFTHGKPLDITTITNNPPPPPTPTITLGGATAGNIGQALTFTASASNCTAAATGWTWNIAGATASGATNGSSIVLSWPSGGSKLISASNSGCGSALGTRSVSITDTSSGALTPSFTFSPTAPASGAAVSFNASASTGGATTIAWDFGDGGIAVGLTATHAFAQNGTYQVKLTLTKSGQGAGCFQGTCIASLTKPIVVGPPPPPPVSSEFTPSVPCTNQFGFIQCDAQTGVQVTVTADEADATAYAWDFGDETTASGRTAAHTWTASGPYSVKLTVTRGTQSSSTTKRFQVTGAVVVQADAVVLPWIAQASGGQIKQTSDLYVYNPGAEPTTVTLEFRKRGTPETTPPHVSRTIAPGSTLFVADVLKDLFGKDNLAGFVTVVPDQGSTSPIITSFNTMRQSDGTQFGQTVPGIPTHEVGSSATDGAGNVQHLVGLSDNAERSAYFGISNPSDAPATYRLRFFDRDGGELGSSPDLVVSRFGQRQFQIREIRDFGVQNVQDYRVDIETVEGGQLFPYGTNLRAGSSDPSYVGPLEPAGQRAYMIGALSTPGLRGSLWESDVVLANITDQSLAVDMSFTGVGLGSTPAAAVPLTIESGKTQRLANVIHEKWGIDNATGILTFATDDEHLPILQGESYDNSHPALRFGQSMPVLTDADAAGAGQGQYLVGLRQDSSYRTTFWLFNPSSETGSYDVIYRTLAGTVLGQINGVGLPPGRSRQFRPGDHPIPASGVAGGFVVQIVVHSGKALAAGQVADNATNDPAYIVGQKR